MTVKALEVSLNGEVLYVVGMDGWSMIGAGISGHRRTKETLIDPKMQEFLDDAKKQSPDAFPAFLSRLQESLRLSCHVGVPDPDRPSSSSGQSYESKDLKIGDTVTIRIIETDSPDLPSEPNAGVCISVTSD